jgi:hypothetical protein
MASFTVDSPMKVGSESNANLAELRYKCLTLNEELSRARLETECADDMFEIASLWLRVDVPSLQRDDAVASSLLQEASRVGSERMVPTDDDSGGSSEVVKLRLLHEEVVLNLRVKLADALRRVGYAESVAKARRDSSVKDGGRRAMRGVTASTQASRPEVRDACTGCYEFPQAAVVESTEATKTLEPMLDQLEDFDGARQMIDELQKDNARLQAQVATLLRQSEQAACDRREELLQFHLQAAAVETRTAAAIDDLTSKLALVSSQLAKARLSSLGASTVQPEEREIVHDPLLIRLRAAEADAQKFRFAADQSANHVALLQSNLREAEAQRLRLDSAAQLLQGQLREKLIEVDLTRQQLARAEQRAAAWINERSAAESSLRSQVVSLSAKLRASQEKTVIDQYKAERNVVSFSAFEDLQLTLDDQQRQLAETRQLLLELVCCENRGGGEDQSRFLDLSSPVAVLPSMSVVDLAKRALIRERSLSVHTPAQQYAV